MFKIGSRIRQSVRKFSKNRNVRGLFKLLSKIIIRKKHKHQQSEKWIDYSKKRNKNDQKHSKKLKICKMIYKLNNSKNKK